MTGRFTNRIAVIAGGGAGIGRRFAHRFAGEGASVVIADLDIGAAKRVVAELAADGARGLACAADVADVEAVSAMASAAVAEFGGIDILVNCAAIHLDHAQLPFDLESVPKWRQVMDVNVVGTLACSAACRPAMAARGGGSIVNMSSMAAYGASGAYGVSKLAVNSLTVSLAAAYSADGIRVNGIAPGLVDSESAVEWANDPSRSGAADIQEQLVAGQMIKRPGRMDDLANLCLFLSSAEAGFITGQTILVDGGYTKKPY
ncbi:MAG TPA: SDR family oxidoreductase [Amycolatopsis sp.]|nr:SDR family oxidoreductase [Amycolatopsis sp.]